MVTIPTHTARVTTAVLQHFMTFSITLFNSEPPCWLSLSVGPAGRVRLLREAVSDFVAKILDLVCQITACFLASGGCEQQADAYPDSYSNQQSGRGAHKARIVTADDSRSAIHTLGCRFVGILCPG